MTTPTPARSGPPARPTVNSFCDRCHKLTSVTQIKSARGIAWLCDGCKPGVLYVPATPHSPPPPDAVPSPSIDQWLEPLAPTGDDVPQDLLDEAIDQEIARADAAAEPIGAEQGSGADDTRRAS